MDDKFIENQDHKPFFRKVETMSDREVQEMNLYLQRENQKELLSIKKNVQFFFYLTLLSLAIAIFFSTK